MLLRIDTPIEVDYYKARRYSAVRAALAAGCLRLAATQTACCFAGAASCAEGAADCAKPDLGLGFFRRLVFSAYGCAVGLESGGIVGNPALRQRGIPVWSRFAKMPRDVARVLERLRAAVRAAQSNSAALSVESFAEFA